MGNKKTKKRNRGYVRARRAREVPGDDVKILNADKGKNKRMRKRLRQAKVRDDEAVNLNPRSLKFGSMNVDGINEDSRYGVETLLQNRKFDVC